jgi:hypothetical protein
VRREDKHIDTGIEQYLSLLKMRANNETERAMIPVPVKSP